MLGRLYVVAFPTILLIVGCASRLPVATAAACWSKWGQWSECSASCDRGIQSRVRFGHRTISNRCPGTSKEFRPCHIAICPSYLDWPRIHFSGRFVATTPTANNFRCYFNNNEFCPACNTNRQAVNVKIPKRNTSAPFYHHLYGSKNPIGNGHFYFTSTKVKSACWNASIKCTTKDPIVNRTVEGTAHGRMVDLDPDWQEASEIIGFNIKVDGVLEGKMSRSAIAHNAIRFPGVGDAAMSPSVKSKLTDVHWIDEDFKEKFNNATCLSFIFVMDIFNYTSMSGRLTGTIGMTSRDDPLTTYGARVMRSFKPSVELKWEVPFHINHGNKKIVLDLSNVIKCNRTGSFRYSTLKHLDIVVLSNARNCPGSSYECYTRALTCGNYEFYLLTQSGAVDKVHETSTWYTDFGGIVEVSLNWMNDDMIHLLSHSRIGLVNRSSLHGEYTNRSKRILYSFCDLFPRQCSRLPNVNGNFCNIVALEQIRGINFKPMNHWTERLSRGHMWKIPAVVTSFGRPLKGVEVRLETVKRSYVYPTCSKKNPCSKYLARPRNGIQFNSPATTNKHGLVNLSVKVVRNIGFPRKCGLDGQVYPLGMLVSYTDSFGKHINIGDGGMFGHANLDWYFDALKQCRLNATYSSFMFAVKVFSSLPASVMRKTCPSWEEDIRPIFQFYYNMFPVMAKHDIINLRSIESVRSKLHLINMSMFEFPWDHPNFMPTTRDLSPDKTEIVRRWIECEVNGSPKQKNAASSRNSKFEEIRANVCGSRAMLNKALTDLRELVQTALLIELYTIPPYLTALFSLKREKFKEAAKILKTISTEEMLHLALDANVLNAIGGNPNLTDAQWLPSYPTPFPSRGFYEIRPDLILKLEPYSQQLAKEVFSEIEKPPPAEVMKSLHDIALLWKDLPEDRGSKWQSSKAEKTNKHRDGTRTENPLWYDVATRTSSRASLNTSNMWDYIFRFATTELEKPHMADVYSIGGFYAHVMLSLLQMEACVKTNSTSSETIFTGKSSRQLDHKQWYVTKGRSSSILFPVRGIKSALEALFEVAYQGEGGTPCTPFITSVAKDEVLSTSYETTRADPYLSQTSPFLETSHYIKFQELAHGRRLQAFQERPPSWSTVTCLPKPDRVCGCSDLSNESVCGVYCFAGKSLEFDESNSVWPVSNLPFLPRKAQHLPTNLKSETREAVLQFDMMYTNMLHCLEKAMNGNPNHMSTCMANMYELLEAGKKLVRLPIHEGGDPMVGPNAGPQWRYVPDPYNTEGIMDFNFSGAKVLFC